MKYVNAFASFLFSLSHTLLIHQVKTLKAELGVVRSNLTMMSDMMSQLDPVTVKQADMELLEVKKKKPNKQTKEHTLFF